ncbi:MAG TPA: sensor domain-containing diguanylate cyclase [Gammaproteobacteria bacterium]|jgi:diguanylate cyclase (GGDEF)-like protein|nr:sensor domain-containing diguanylate cyclase [Gammaproteobacteria bacterium]
MSEPDMHPSTSATEPRAGARVSRERLLEVIASIGKVMTVSGSLQAVMDVVSEECTRLTRADGATIFMVENQRLTAKSAVGILGFALLEMPLSGGSPSHAVKLRRAVRSSDAQQEDQTLRRVSSRSGSRSSVSAPFYFGREPAVAGVLHMASLQPDAFTDEDEDIIQMFADMVASAIQNARQYDQVVRESREDALTGLLNRRAFEEHARMLKKEQVHHDKPYSLILFDINDLKIINDENGHPAGDEAIRLVATAARMRVRKSDIVYRLGGDEFAILLPQTGLAAAEEVSKRVEASVMEQFASGRPLSVSSGTCEAACNESVPLLLTRTDQLMYLAKRLRHTGTVAMLGISPGHSTAAGPPVP